MNFINKVGNVFKSAFSNTPLERLTSIKVFGFSDFKNGYVSDKRLIKEGFCTNGDVYSITNDLSLKSSQINIKSQKTNNRQKAEEYNGLLYDLLHNDPKESKNSKIFKASLNIKLTGDIFTEVVTAIGFTKPTSLVVHRSGMVEIERRSDGAVRHYTVCEEGVSRQIQPENMIHTALYDPSFKGDESGRGISPLQAGYMALLSSNELQIASASLLKNKGASYIISDSSNVLSDGENAKMLQKAVNSRIGGADKAGQVTATGGDIKVHDIGMNAKDLELIKTWPIKLKQLCNIYRVSSAFYNDPSGVLFGGEFKEAEKSFYTNGVAPDLELYLADLSRFFSRYEKGVELLADYSGIKCLQGDEKEEAEKNKIVSDGILSVLNDTFITPSQKLNTLITIWKMTEEEAKLLTK